jgi:hypothetical protein
MRRAVARRPPASVCSRRAALPNLLQRRRAVHGRSAGRQHRQLHGGGARPAHEREQRLRAQCRRAAGVVRVCCRVVFVVRCLKQRCVLCTIKVRARARARCTRARRTPLCINAASMAGVSRAARPAINAAAATQRMEEAGAHMRCAVRQGAPLPSFSLSQLSLSGVPSLAAAPPPQPQPPCPPPPPPRSPPLRRATPCACAPPQRLLLLPLLPLLLLPLPPLPLPLRPLRPPPVLRAQPPPCAARPQPPARSSPWHTG